MTTVTTCGTVGCGALTYRLTTTNGQPITLDTTEHQLGTWTIHGDQAQPVTNSDVIRAGEQHVAYRRHECTPAVQPGLFEVDGAA